MTPPSIPLGFQVDFSLPAFWAAKPLGSRFDSDLRSKRYVVPGFSENGSLLELLEMVVEVNGCCSAAHSILQKILEDLEAGPRVGIGGSILQVRNLDVPQAVEIKAYLQLLQDPDLTPDPLIGRRAALRLAQILSPWLGDRAGAMAAEIIRRNEIAPVSLVGVRMTDQLELETYHDHGSGSWSAQEVASLIAEIGRSDALSKGAFAIASCFEDHGFVIRHFSNDLVPFNTVATLAADPGSESLRTYDAMLNLTAALSALPGSRCPAPTSLDDVIIRPEFEPGVVAVKVTRGPLGETAFDILVEGTLPALVGLV